MRIVRVSSQEASLIRLESLLQLADVNVPILNVTEITIKILGKHKSFSTNASVEYYYKIVFSSSSASNGKSHPKAMTEMMMMMMEKMASFSCFVCFNNTFLSASYVGVSTEFCVVWHERMPTRPWHISDSPSIENLLSVLNSTHPSYFAISRSMLSNRG